MARQNRPFCRAKMMGQVSISESAVLLFYRFVSFNSFCGDDQSVLGGDEFAAFVDFGRQSLSGRSDCSARARDKLPRFKRNADEIGAEFHRANNGKTTKGTLTDKKSIFLVVPLDEYPAFFGSSSERGIIFTQRIERIGSVEDFKGKRAHFLSSERAEKSSFSLNDIMQLVLSSIDRRGPDFSDITFELDAGVHNGSEVDPTGIIITW
jgi:hypothetical protein